MPHFLIGDEQGFIKSLEYRTEPFEDGSRCRITVLPHRNKGEQKVSIQRLALSGEVGGSKAVVAAHSDGNVVLSTVTDGSDEELENSKQWKDSRFKKDSSYIGLSTYEDKVFSCTTNGALQLTTINDPTTDLTSICHCISLPTRLRDWQLSPSSTTFTYGGDEVDPSIWDTETAFHSQDSKSSATASKKRKRNNELFPGEIWRAKNVANDNLGLRQPIRVTSIDYLRTGSVGHCIVAGTQLGDVRQYDIRAARRPVADWKGIGKAGGIQVVKKGLSDHELFVSDCGTNLFALDTRNGRVVYGYKGLSGAVTSIAPAPGIVISTSKDRYTRVHTTFAPPTKEGQNINRKGEILEKVYVASTPTVAIWDRTAESIRNMTSPIDEQDDAIWDNLEQIGGSDTERQGGTKRRHVF